MIPTRNPDVVCMTVDGGAVLLHTTTEIYFGLDAVGANVWDLLRPDIRDLESLCIELGKLYPDVEQAVLLVDVRELLDTLTAEGLVLAPLA